MSFFSFLFRSYSTLHLLQNTFYRIEISCFWGYACSIRTLKKTKKSNKKLKIFRVIIFCNHRFNLLKLFWVIKGFILYQINQVAFKSGYNFTTYGKFMNTSWIEDLQIRKLFTEKSKWHNDSRHVTVCQILFGHLAQSRSDKRWVLSPCVTIIISIRRMQT